MTRVMGILRNGFFEDREECVGLLEGQDNSREKKTRKKDNQEKKE